jgi:predicted dehydrogenase
MGSGSRMAASAPLRAAIIGCGQIAGGYDAPGEAERVLTHAHAYSIHSGTRLVGVADTDGERARAFADRWHANAAFDDPRRMLEELRPDIVSICSPTESHVEWLSACLEAEPRAVWCEKPLARTMIQSAPLVSAFAASGIELAVNYLRRWDPALDALRERCHAERGTAIRGVAVYGKGLLNNGSHAVDLLLDLLGPVKDVRALSSFVDLLPHDPTITAHLAFASGAEALLVGNDERDVTVWELDILGPGWRTRLTQAGASIEEYRVREDPIFQGYREYEPTPARRATGLHRAMLYALENVVDAIHHGEPLRSSGVTALATLDICERISAMAPLHVSGDSNV